MRGAQRVHVIAGLADPHRLVVFKTMAAAHAVAVHAQHLGFENLFIQPLDAGNDFLPDFDRDKPFTGNP